MLVRLRSAIPAEARERYYVIASAVIVFLGSWGLLETSIVLPVTQVVLSSITLLFALLYATATWRAALYTVLLAVQGLGMALHFLNDSQWTAILALAATMLGTATAAAKTPTPIDP